MTRPARITPSEMGRKQVPHSNAGSGPNQGNRPTQSCGSRNAVVQPVGAVRADWALFWIMVIVCAISAGVVS